MTQLQKIVAKAKTLKKSHPNTKWTDLIKKASKLVTPASKSVGAVKKKKAVKKYAPVKPLAKNKKEVKKSPSKSLHKDTKSHNVNIRVVSGVSKSHKLKLLNIIDERLKSINQLEQNIKYVKDLMTRFDPYRTKSDILKMKKEIKEYKDYISLFKYDIRVMKKHIK